MGCWWQEVVANLSVYIGGAKIYFAIWMEIRTRLIELGGNFFVTYDLSLAINRRYLKVKF